MILFVLGSDAERYKNAVSNCPMAMDFLFLKTEDIAVLEATVKAIAFDIVIIDVITTMDLVAIREIMDQLETRVIIAIRGYSNKTFPDSWLDLMDMFLVLPSNPVEIEMWCKRLMREPTRKARAMAAKQKATGSEGSTI